MSANLGQWTLLTRARQKVQPGAMATAATAADPNYALSLTKLRFLDAAVECRFAREHVVLGLPTIRAFLACASLLYALFGILDMHVIPEAVHSSWLVRYGIVCPWLLGTACLTRFSWFTTISQPLLFSCVFVAGFGILVMTAVASSPGNGLYYAGLIMVVIYGASLVRLRCIPAAACSLLLVLLYQIVAILINPITPHLLWNNDFFLSMSVGIGIFSSYVQEVQARRDFISTEQLRDQKSQSERLLITSEAANRAKSDFLAVMSHELRTPLNAILGFSEIMEQQMFGPLGSDRYAAYISDIHATAEHLLRIITDILDLSKAEVGKLTLSEEDADIWSIVDQSFRLLRERAAENGIRLSLAAASEQPTMRVDPTLIKQVCLNLIGNAIKFTPSGGSVEGKIAIDADGDCLVTIADTGIGIAEKDLPRVLEPFVQVESAMARKHGGTGLGLPLVKKIVELHGGTLALTSTLGAGTCVTVRLPARRVVSQQSVTGAAAA